MYVGTGSRGVLLKGDKVLLVLSKESMMWEFPGGRIENSETPEKAVKRELREETGIEVQNMEWLGSKN